MAHDHAHPTHDTLDAAPDGDSTGRSELLRSRGLRVTASRLAVLDLLDHALEPMTHHDVVEALQQSPWNRSTLYRNLIDLTEVGLLIKSDIGGLARFERAGRLNPCAGHPHFVCTSCGTVSHLDDVSVHFAGHGPSAVMTGQVAVQLRGRCDDCE